MKSLRLAIASGLLVASAVGAQEKPSDTLLTVNHYLNYETVGDPRISPDGQQVIYTRRWVNRLADRWESSLWIMSADGTKNRFLSKGGSAIWSPDGTRIAFLGEGEPRGTQLFVRWMDAEGAVSQLTRVENAPTDVKWSPDGKSLGFVMFVAKSEPWKIDMPEAPKGATWTGAPRVVQSLHFRQDRRGFTETGHTHLFVVPAEGGTPRQITKGDWNVGARFDQLAFNVGWDWSRDGRTVYVDGMDDAKADLNYRNANIYSVDVASGALTRLTKSEGAWTSPVVSPDGRRIAYAGYPATKASYRAADLYVMNTDGSGAQKISADFDRDPNGIHWAPDGSGVYFAADDHGSANIHFAAATGGVRRLTAGAQMLSLASLSKSGIAVGVRSAPHAPPDLYRTDLKRPTELTQLTRVNEDVFERVKLGAVEEFTVASTGGAKVQGWIVKPPNFDASKKYPMIMEIHGGPHGMYGVGFNYMFQNFAANGYVVLYTNPRGSTGYGSDFGNAIERRYPGVDYEDLMVSVDTLVGRGYIDTDKMYVGGCSGGGVLSSWVIGHTTRFAAAAVRCPVTNWISMAGQTDVPLFTYNFFDKPFWEAPQKWLEQSPLMYVGNVTTPTVVMTGELDLRTPMPQSDEYYTALKMRGVPTALLRFEGEYHGTGSRPSNFIRTQLYMMSWYGKYTKKTAM